VGLDSRAGGVAAAFGSGLFADLEQCMGSPDQEWQRRLYGLQRNPAAAPWLLSNEQ
jgi:hypothetical protein